LPIYFKEYRIYYIVDDLEGNTPRKGGDFPNSVKERAQLVVTEMRIGSVEAQLAISDTQMGLPGASTFGALAPHKLGTPL